MRILPESSWRPVLQRSIDAFYEGRNSEGIEACITLLQATGVLDDVRELTYRNQTFYAQSLPELVAGARWSALEAPGWEGSAVLEASPFLNGSRVAMLLRA